MVNGAVNSSILAAGLGFMVLGFRVEGFRDLVLRVSGTYPQSRGQLLAQNCV